MPHLSPALLDTMGAWIDDFDVDSVIARLSH
ncbi:MAG: hypothetical protein JWQ81_3522 [Amycolatopsis sp.]|jgi:hypothetical protein|nr:hypothetical protein [Amycolatopsis sp.]